MRTINDCRDWRDQCFTLISVNKPEDKVSTRYKWFCEGCEWKSHELMPESQRKEGTLERGSRRGKRRSDIVYLLVKMKFDDIYIFCT